MTEDFDVVILGSGFGGTLLATILTRQGYLVAVLDRTAHPRFAIGESSTPAADLILRDLCRVYGLDNLAPLTRYGTWKQAFPQLNCGKKRGFSYFHHSSGKPFATDAENRNQLLVAASSDDLMCDMHWYRANVDQMLADNARRSGVTLIEQAAVRSIRQTTAIPAAIPERTGWVIEYEVQQGSSPAGERLAAVRGRFVIDASGQSQLLLNQLNIPDVIRELKTNSRAVYTHMRRVGSWTEALGPTRSARHPFDSDAAAQHHLIDEGWLWLLRFDDGTASVGICFDETRQIESKTNRESATNSEDPANEFGNVIAKYPDLAQLFSDAQLSETPGKWHRTDRLQRLRAQASGDSWVALPHSVGFIDPLHSTGIALTMFAIEQIAAAFDPKKTDTQRRQEFEQYNSGLISTLKWIDQLVWACYRTRGHNELFHAVVILYFTATVHFEQTRSTTLAKPAAAEFLSADWQMLREIGDWVVAELGALPSEDPDTLDALAHAIVEKLAPLSNVGLGDPAAKRMYQHTNCDVEGRST